MTTIHDVARAAGVSTATVSRALAGSAAVAPATRARVHRTAQRLGYVPNTAARQLVTGRGQSIGLVLPDLENPFYAAVAKGVQHRVRAAGFTAVMADTDEDVDTERTVLGQLSAGIDRLILASPRVPDGDVQELAARARVVLINRQVPAAQTPVASVVPDNTDGIAQALRHLYNLGHRHVGYAGGPATSWSDAQRRCAYQGSSTPGLRVVDLGAYRPGQEGGVAAADEAIARGVSAVLAFNDQLAIGILGRLAARGVPVPEAISVVGFDDVPVARLLAPALTTVAVPAQRIGARAVDLLMADPEPGNGPGHSEEDSRHDGDGAPQVVMDVELRVRSSTAEPAAGSAAASRVPV